MATAHSILCADDDRVRVSTLTFADGAETGYHRHAYDYLVVPVTGGTFRVEEADGSTRELTQMPGEPYQGPAGTEHNVVNVSGTTVSFVEVEFKR
ncbi:MAG TPA: cupin domain-containing protein [Gaiellales bacterium]|jgi:quercetin dioxygenase-like cupin family protein|nr:cupin domain-containing protein [Gaiellales bacterium]